MKLYLIRHPLPEGSKGLCYGRLDLPVARPAFMATAAQLIAKIPEDLLRTGPVYSSPASRCLGLAEQLCLVSGIRPMVMESLAELDFGSWEGCAWDAISRQNIDAWANDIWHYRPGGKESAQQLLQRWRYAKAAIQAKGNDAVIVTHAGIIRMALFDGGVGTAQTAFDFPVPFGSVHQIG